MTVMAQSGRTMWGQVERVDVPVAKATTLLVVDTIVRTERRKYIFAKNLSTLKISLMKSKFPIYLVLELLPQNQNWKL